MAKDDRLDLHTNGKKTLILMGLFVIVSVFLNVIVAISSIEGYLQLDVLRRSKYDYSVSLQKPLLQDEYYQFDAGISFADNLDSERSLNAEVLMQTDSAIYTDQVYWNAQPLSTYEVAISGNLSRSYGLQLGDILFSKHSVNGLIQEYTIAQILPDVIHAQVIKNDNFRNGVIIMGCDDRYVENVSHRIIAFTKEPIDTIAGSFPENIIYRDAEIAETLKKTLPLVIVEIILQLILTILLIHFLNKDIVYDFRRRITIGYGEKRINLAHKRFLGGHCAAAIAVAAFIALVIIYLINAGTVGVIVLIISTIMQLITIDLSIAYCRRRLWR